MAWVVTTELLAVPFQLTYVGRMTGKDGKPVEGPVELEVSFYRSASGGDEIVPSLSFSNVGLKDGVFQVALDLAPADWHRVFDERAGPAYIAIHDVTHQKTYPRQMFGAVPYAFKVPVDGNTVTYDAYGRLTVASVTGGNQYVKLDGSAKLPAVDGSQLTGVVASSVGGKTAAAVGSTVDAVSQASASTGNGTLVKRDANGGIGAGKLTIDTAVGSAPGLIVTGASGQSADLQEWRSSGGALLAAIDPTGMLKLGSGAFYVGLKAPAGMTANAVYTLPDAPVNGKFLTTDATGKLSWGTPAGGGGGGSVAATDVTGLTAGSVAFATASGLGEDNANFFWDATNKRLGLGTAAPFADVTLGGSMDRILAMERTTVAGGTGSHLTLQAGGAKSGVADKDGGTLILSSGLATGTGGSSIQLKTATPQGGSAATDNAPTTKVTILGNGNVGIGVPNPSSTLYVNGSQSVNGPLTMLGTGMVTNKIKLNDATNMFSVSLRAPVNLVADVSWILPDSDGTSGQVLTTGGNGQLSWSDPSSLGTDITLNGTAARYIQQSRSPTANTAGGGVSVIAGGAATGATDKDGGPLILSSGLATGSGSSSIQFQTAGGGAAGTADRSPTTRMTILGNGNVGIGTATPLTNLHVEGDAFVSGSLYTSTITSDWTSFTSSLNLTSGRNANLVLTTGSGGTGMMFAKQDGTTWTELMRILPNGNLGLGTISPANKLDVSGGVAIGSYAGTAGTSNGLVVSGNVGIGTKTPSDIFNVSAPPGHNAWFHLGADQAIYLDSTATDPATAGTPLKDSVGLFLKGSYWDGAASTGVNGGVLVRPTDTAGKASLALQVPWGVDRMVVASSGNVGIGTPTPEAKLEIDGTSPGGLLKLGGGDNNAGSSDWTQIAFGFAGTSQFPHFIRTRHNANAPTFNAIDFYTNDGTGNGVFPTNAIHGLSIVNGSVGIGETSPDGKLHLAFPGPVWTSNGWTKALRIDKNGAIELGGTDAKKFGIGAVGGNMYVFETTSEDTSAAASPLMIMGGGNVTIGSWIPRSTLTLKGAASTPTLTAGVAGIVEFTDGLTDLVVTTDGNSPFTTSFQHRSTFSDGFYYPIALNPLGGRVGIGTSDPKEALHVMSQGSSSSETQLVLENPSSADYAIDYLQFKTGGAHRAQITAQRNGSAAGGWLSFFTNDDAGTSKERIRIDETGKVGVGTSNPSNTLHVVGSLCVKSGAGNCSGNAAGTIYASTTTVSGADLAEHMPVEGARLAPGDVVAAQASASDGKAGVFVKTRVAHQANAVGVVSTNPGVTLGAETKDSRPVALAGRVPVNVTLEGGPIAVGDHLVASSTPGKAMKAKDAAAGGIIGIALSAYDGRPVPPKPSRDGIAHESGHQVMMLVQPKAVTPEAVAAKDREIAALRMEVKKLGEAWGQMKDALCAKDASLAICRP